MARFGLLATFGGLALVWGGGQGTYTALKAPEPKEFNCLEFAKTPDPSAIWVKLKGCPVDLSESVYFYNEKKPNQLKDVYVPVVQEENSAPTKLVLHSKRSEWLSLVQQIRKLENDSKAFLKWSIENQSAVAGVRDIEGLIEFGINASGGSEHKKVADLLDDLARDFVVVEEGTKPRLGFSLAMLGGGLACAAGGAFSLLRRFLRSA